MLTQARWNYEMNVMREYFPSFTPFSTSSGCIGFFGRLKGPRSGRTYQVVLKASADMYPQAEPAVYMEPRPEHHHWIVDGRLCYRRLDLRIGALRTFPNCLLIAIKYVEEFDR